MKKNQTYKLDEELIKQLQERAAAEDRSLTNFIEVVFKAAIKTIPAKPPALIIESKQTAVKTDIIQSVKYNNSVYIVKNGKLGTIESGIFRSVQLNEGETWQKVS